MKDNFTISEYLSLGYLYLLVLGILEDAIYYSFLDINILKYATILDVLLSPIVLLTSNVGIPIIIIIAIIFLYVWVAVLAPRFHKRYREKKWYRKFNKDIDKSDQRVIRQSSVHFLIKATAGLILSFYLGLGIGGGIATSERIETNKLKSDHIITFQDKQTLKVKIIGQNSAYLFYVATGEKQITIAPIIQNIKTIQKLDEE